MDYMTTFWDDFTIAEHFGQTEIEDTAKRCFNDWKDNLKFLTELVMILNHKSWYFFEKDDQELCSLYTELYYQYNELAYEYLKVHDPDGLHYFFETLD